MRNIFLSVNGVGVIIKTNFVNVPRRDVKFQSEMTLGHEMKQSK